jgi:xyloglucan-specific exo-beta-1,4-glucanase
MINKSLAMLQTALMVCLTGAARGDETATAHASPAAPSAEAITAHAANASAHRFRWARVAIGGGGFNTGVYVHPRLPDTVYSRIDVGGLYRWDETRARWFQTMDWMPTDFNATKGVDGVAIDPGAGRAAVIYAALGQYPYTLTTSAQGNGLWRSLDGGRSWTKIFGLELPGGLALFGSNMADRMYGERIAVDPSNSRVVYAGTRTAGLYRSVNALDAGPAFQKITSMPDGVQRFGPNVILLDPRAGTTGQGDRQRSRLVYAAYSCNREDCAAGRPVVFDGGVYRSQDGGETFSRIGGAGEPAVVKRMALGADGSLLVVPNEGNGILKWDGAGWSVLPGTADVPFNALATDAADPRRLLAWSNPGFYGDLWRSTDAGQTWSVVSVNNGKLDLAAVNWLNGGFALNISAHVVFDPFHRNRIYWTEPYATYRADDVFADQVTAQPLLEGSETTVNFALAAPANGKGRSRVKLYGAFADVRGFRFTNLKEMPQSPIFPTNGGGMLSDVVSAPNDPRSVIVSQPTDTGSDGTFPDGLPRLKLSQDDGVTWLEKTGPPIDPRSADANKSAGPAKIAISATDKRRIVYFGSRRMPHFASNAFSTETLNWQAGNGVAWDTLPSYAEYDNSLVRLEADVVDGMRFYLLVGSTDYSKPAPVYVSQDGGANWRVPALQNLPLAGFPALRHMVSVKTRSDPTPADGELWLSLGNNGVWRSSDGASQFSRVNEAALADVRGIAFGKPAGANAEPTLFVAGKVKIDGVIHDGVFLSPDLGQTFVQMTPGERPYVGGQAIRDMVGDPDVFGRVYIGLDGTGIIYSELKSP